MQSTRGSLGAWLFLDIVEGLDRLGVPAAPVLATCGLTRGRLRNPFARLDAAVEHAFWAELERVAGDPAIGLKLGVDVALRGKRNLDAYIAFTSVDPLLYTVQTALLDGLQPGQVGLTSIVRSTGMSTRTLRRRLSELGTTFQEQLDELRHGLAVEGSRSGQESIAQIAERLSYASGKAFQSAFRRWTGVAPSVYRQRQRAMGSELDGRRAS